MTAFVAERAVVAVGHAVQIEAHHLVAIGDGVHAIALDRSRRAHACPGPVEENVAF